MLRPRRLWFFGLQGNCQTPAQRLAADRGGPLHNLLIYLSR